MPDPATPISPTLKCGRCRSPILNHEPRVHAIDTEIDRITLLCAYCGRVVLRFRLIADVPPPSSLQIDPTRALDSPSSLPATDTTSSQGGSLDHPHPRAD
jgi:hypothetical protein